MWATVSIFIKQQYQTCLQQISKCTPASPPIEVLYGVWVLYANQHAQAFANTANYLIANCNTGIIIIIISGV